MATGNFVLDKGYDVAAAVTKFRFVKYSAAEQVTPVTAITDNPAGVAQFGVSSSELSGRNKGTDVRLMGISEVEASGAIAVGAMCQLENDGRVSALVAASGKRIVGQCVGHPSTNAGDRISMFIIKGGALA